MNENVNRSNTESVNSELNKYINSALKKEIYSQKKVNSCPYCESINFIKYGSYQGIQRYRCKNCGKTFSKTTNAALSHTKKGLSLWIQFLQMFLEKKSLRCCAKELDITLTTAFYWRHRILDLIKSNNNLSNISYEDFVKNVIMSEKKNVEKVK